MNKLNEWKIWLVKRLKSKTIWLTTIAPGAMAFMSMYSEQLNELLNGNYNYVFMVFAALAWYSRETTDESLDAK